MSAEVNASGTKRAGRASVVEVAVVGVLVWVSQTLHFVFAMITTVPKFEKIFRDFGVALPPLSRWFIMLSREFRVVNAGQLLSMTQIGLVVWTLAVLGAAWFCASRRSVWPGLVFLVLGLILWAIMGLLLVMAMDLPLRSMIRSMQGGSP